MLFILITSIFIKIILPLILSYIALIIFNSINPFISKFRTYILLLIFSLFILNINSIFILKSNLINWFNALPTATKPVFLTSSATLIGAFIGACIAQYFSHLLSLKRENIKYLREAYEELYAPILLDVYAYIDITTSFERNREIKSDINEQDIKQKIINHIGNKLIYSSPSLIWAYNTVKKAEYKVDYSDYNDKLNELNLILTFLNELRILAENTAIFDKKSYRNLINTIFLYKLWVIFTELYNDFDYSTSILCCKHFFNYNKLNMRNYRRICRHSLINKIKEKIFEKMKFLGEFNNKSYINYIKYLISDRKEQINLNNIFEYSGEKIKENFDYNPQLIQDIGLLIHNINYCIKEKILTFNFLMRNCSKTVKKFKISDFILRRNLITVIRSSCDSSGFWDGFSYNLKVVELVEDEETKVSLSFNIDEKEFLYYYYLDIIINSKTHNIFDFYGEYDFEDGEKGTPVKYAPKKGLKEQ